MCTTNATYVHTIALSLAMVSFDLWGMEQIERPRALDLEEKQYAQEKSDRAYKEVCQQHDQLIEYKEATALLCFKQALDAACKKFNTSQEVLLRVWELDDCKGLFFNHHINDISSIEDVVEMTVWWEKNKTILKGFFEVFGYEMCLDPLGAIIEYCYESKWNKLKPPLISSTSKEDSDRDSACSFEGSF